MCRPGPIQIISSHISSDGSLPEVGAQPPSGGPQKLSDASDVKNAPNGTVMSEDGDWGRLADAFAARPDETDGRLCHLSVIDKGR